MRLIRTKFKSFGSELEPNRFLRDLGVSAVKKFAGGALGGEQIYRMLE